MREYEQEHLRVRAKPTVSRSVLDDVSEWWHGSEQVAERAPKPEPAASLSSSRCVWRASSCVGAMASARSPRRCGAPSRASIWIRNAAVLPEPVGAHAGTSR